MSIEEKIQTMEVIWEDLCKKADSISSPSWHKKVLDDKEEKIKKGDDEFVNWSGAQKNIKNSIL